MCQTRRLRGQSLLSPWLPSCHALDVFTPIRRSLNVPFRNMSLWEMSVCGPLFYDGVTSFVILFIVFSGFWEVPLPSFSLFLIFEQYISNKQKKNTLGENYDKASSFQYFIWLLFKCNPSWIWRFMLGTFYSLVVLGLKGSTLIVIITADATNIVLSICQALF